MHSPGSRGDLYGRGPVFIPSPSLPYGWRRGTPRRRPRPGINILEESEDSDSTLADMDDMGPRRHRGRRGTMGRRGGFERRPRSAPEMFRPGMRGMGTGLGMPSPRMGGMGPMGMNMGGMGPGGIGSGGMGPVGMGPSGLGPSGLGPSGIAPGGMGGMGYGMEPGESAPFPMGGMAMPPAYAPHAQMPPRYPVGASGMPGGGTNPYPLYPGAPPSPPSSKAGHAPSRPHSRPSKRPPGHEYIPMGAYAAEPDRPRRPSRSRTEPPTSTRLNRGHTGDRKVGPSGKEWIEGDSFLDACVCTTACKCRKSQRVLYRSRRDRNKGSESDDDGPDYGSGEIRFILKDDLGRDCGDHSGCNKKGDGDSEKEEKTKTAKKNKEEKERKEQFAGFKEELLEALNERFRDMKKDTQRGRAASSSPAPLPFGAQKMGPSPFMMDQPTMDPRLAQQMGMAMGADPYGMGTAGIARMPPSMMSPMGRQPIRPPGMQMGPMANAGMGFEDDMSLPDMDGMGSMGLNNPYAMAGRLGKKPMRPSFMSPCGGKAGARFASGGMGQGKDTDPMASAYNRGSKMRGGRGIMRNHRPGAGRGRQARADWESDSLDIGVLRRRKPARRGDDNGDEDEYAMGAMTSKSDPTPKHLQTSS